jgi:protein-S-isoprenylcysteine O-methyltransferase Ste14
MMQLFLYLISAFLLLVGALVVFRICVRRDYRRKGRLTPFSSFLELLIWGLYMSFPYIYNPANWPWTHHPHLSPVLRGMGWIIIALGAAIAFPAMAWLGLSRSLDHKVNLLKRTGFYRLTRNPQIVGGALLVVGSAALWPSWYALGWLILYAAVAHMMVLTEEEHLRDAYGDEYARYCERVPRYLGFPWRS